MVQYMYWTTRRQRTVMVSGNGTKKTEVGKQLMDEQNFYLLDPEGNHMQSDQMEKFTGQTWRARIPLEYLNPKKLSQKSIIRVKAIVLSCGNDKQAVVEIYPWVQMGQFGLSDKVKSAVASRSTDGLVKAGNAYQVELPAFQWIQRAIRGSFN